MGCGVQVICGKCGWEKEFVLGVGMMDASLEDAVKDRRLSGKHDILEILHTQRVTSTTYGYELFYCPDCDHLYALFYARIEYDGDHVFETTYDCFRCHARLEPISLEDIDSLPCPKCGEEGLKQMPTMLWD